MYQAVDFKNNSETLQSWLFRKWPGCSVTENDFNSDGTCRLIVVWKGSRHKLVLVTLRWNGLHEKEPLKLSARDSVEYFTV